MPVGGSYHVNIGDVETPGRKEILMPGHCDASIRASTHGRDPATCHPDTQPKTGCCCYPGCDQGKCSSFKFERNIVYQPPTATGIFVGTTFAEGTPLLLSVMLPDVGAGAAAAPQQCAACRRAWRCVNCAYRTCPHATLTHFARRPRQFHLQRQPVRTDPIGCLVPVYAIAC